ncbi:hypothetical protein GX50_07345 [[Emmonsia] crescens]|uniref:Uncharacterized protein n=1 Tax=[Emmonsia] crescens TaxID=73230 RepID=A0A2B7Z9N1_9EURO|nr:hypothetical protein GX50_07345 [Emmonsia crescens]
MLSGNLDMALLLPFWLAHDSVESRYVTLKLYVADLNNTHELKAYACLNAAGEVGPSWVIKTSSSSDLSHSNTRYNATLEKLGADIEM